MKCESDGEDIVIYRQIDGFIVCDKSSYTQLRAKHRIVPKLVGLPDVGSHNVQANSTEAENLPAILMSEQARYVCERGIAQCYVMPDALEMKSLLEHLPKDEEAGSEAGTSDTRKAPSGSKKRKNDMSQMTLEEVVAKLKRDHDRKRQRIQSSSKTTDYSKKRNDSISNMSHEHFVQIAEKILEEQRKYVPPPEIYIRTGPRKDLARKMRSYQFEDLTDEILLCRYHTFCDLHERGFYLTPACKFGGDFLVYHGDPLQYHASFVAVATPDETVNLNILLAQIRVSHNVHKHLLLCQLMKDQHNERLHQYSKNDARNEKTTSVEKCPSLSSLTEIKNDDERELNKNEYSIKYTLLDYIKAAKP